MTKTQPARGDTISRALVLGAAVICAGVFVFLLRRRSFHGAGSLTAFLVASALLALLYASAIFWRSSARLKLLLISFSLVGSVYLAEIAITVIIARNAKLTASTPGALAPTADHRTKLEVVGDLRAAGQDAWPTIHPQMFLATGGLPVGGGTLLPLGGISRARSVYCLESDAYALFDSDEHGFNNPLGLHEKDAVDVALLGDSFVQGACVQQGEDVTSRLRAGAPPRSALSLGNGGDGPLTELATLIEYGAPLHPRVVLWFYYEGNDLLDLEAERRVPALMRYVDSDFTADLRSRQPAIDAVLKSFVEKKRDVIREEEPHASSSLLRTLKLSTLRERLNVISFPEPSPLFTRTLTRSKEIVAGWGGKLYFVYLPEWSRYAKRTPKTNWKYRSYGHVLEIAKQLDVPVIDFQESVAALEDPLSQFPQRQPGHYNPAGYARLAEAIRARLAADKALP